MRHATRWTSAGFSLVEMQIALAITAFIIVAAYAMLNAIQSYQNTILRAADREDLARYIRMVVTDPKALKNSLEDSRNDRMQKCFNRAVDATHSALCKTGKRYNFYLLGPEPSKPVVAGIQRTVTAGNIQYREAFYSTKGRRCVETNEPTISCPLAVSTSFEVFNAPSPDRGPSGEPGVGQRPELVRIIYKIEIPQEFLAANPSLTQGQATMGDYENAITISFGDMDLASLGLSP